VAIYLTRPHKCCQELSAVWNRYFNTVKPKRDQVFGHDRYCKDGVRVKVLRLDLARLETDVVALGSYNYGLDIVRFTHERCLNWVSEPTWFSKE
jgi:hypothetical protein